MDTTYTLDRYQRTTDVGMSECVEVNRERSRLAAASSVYDSTKHNGPITHVLTFGLLVRDHLDLLIDIKVQYLYYTGDIN